MASPTHPFDPSNEMTPAKAAALRAPFPASAVGYKPTLWCRACKDSRTKVCENPQHQKVRCEKCRQNVSRAHTDLAFAGHAEVTDRLLQVDPTWYWEPLAYTPEGLPAIDRETGGLWIKLTICGVTRIGFGDAEGKTGPSATKELIGDAVRVTAMRFGVGLDLWGASGRGEAQAQAAVDHVSDTAPEQPHTAAQNGNGHGHQRSVQGGNGNGKRPAAGPEQVTKAATALLDAVDAAALEKLADLVEQRGIGDRDATGALTAEDRLTLGLDDSDKVTLDDLVALLRSYHQRHQIGPRAGDREPAPLAG